MSINKKENEQNIAYKFYRKNISIDTFKNKRL